MGVYTLGAKFLVEAISNLTLQFALGTWNFVYMFMTRCTSIIDRVARWYPLKTTPGGWNIPKITFDWNIAKIKRSTEKYWQKVVQRSIPYQSMPENAGSSAYFHISGWKVVQKGGNMQLTLSELCILRYKTEILYTYLW